VEGEARWYFLVELSVHEASVLFERENKKKLVSKKSSSVSLALSRNESGPI